MPQNTVPRNLQGGPSFTFGDGSRTTRGKASDINEIINFVRTTQHGITRETTEMRLQKKAPLPGIGQSYPQSHEHHPSRRNSIHINSNSLDTDNTDGSEEGYEVDLQDSINGGMKLKSGNPLGINHGLTKSLEAMQHASGVNAPANGVVLKPIKGQRHLDHSPTRNPRAVRTLPPMILMDRPQGAHQRTLPNRPNAPSPDDDMIECDEEEEFELES